MKIPADSAEAVSYSGDGGGVGETKTINTELWHACAGPLVNLPAVGTHVVYFPQGHSEQVAASMKKDIDGQIPNYPNLPSKLPCILLNVTLHADAETDEVYAQMILQPVPSYDMEALLRSDIALKSNKPQTEFFCKTLTASDTSTHGGFSVPRRAAERIFPPLDFSTQPPAQELVARDLHDNIWNFRHIYRGQPKRHLLTTGWSLFVSGKRLFAGDSVLFIRDEKQRLHLGIRQANRQPTNLSSSVLSSDSMHIGILAAAAHAAANNSPFTVFYNPRASPSEFVIPLAKYYKAVHSNQISLGMRFRMIFETEECGTRRYMGTITGISDLDPVRWKNSQWRNLQVGWDDESTAVERRNRVSIWEIEPVTAPFFIHPPPFFRSKHPRQADDNVSDMDNVFKRTMPWIVDDFGMKDSQALPGLSLVQWMNMQQNPSLVNAMPSSYMHSLHGPIMQNLNDSDVSWQLGLPQISQQNNLQSTGQSLPPQVPSTMNPLGSIIPPQQPLGDITQQLRQTMISQALPSGQVQAQILQPQNIVQTNNILQQQPSIQNPQLPVNLPQNLQKQHIMGQNQQQNLMQSLLPDQINQNLQMSDKQIQPQLLQKLQQPLLAQQSALQQPAQLTQLQDQQRQLLDASQSFSRSVTPTQMLEMPQVAPTPLPQTNIISQQIAKRSGLDNVQFSHPSQLEQQLPGILYQMPGHLGRPQTHINTQVSMAGNGVLTGAAGVGQSVIIDDNPSCSTTPSTSNCQRLIQPMINSRVHQSVGIGEEVALSDATLLSPSVLETMPSDTNLVKYLRCKSDVKPSVNISKTQKQGFFAPQTYLNGAASQTDYLDTSSSTTSVCLSQNDVHLQQNNSSLSDNLQSMLRDTNQDGEVLADPMSNIPYGTNIDGALGSMDPNSLLTKGLMGLGKSNNISSGGILTNNENSKDALQELSSSIVSQSFGVPDIAFNSIDSTINDSSFLNRGSWAQPPQFPQRMRTYTKVYKRGAVGRSIDITRYSGYDELKQDLARRFGIEGQLEDRGRIGWKLVYVDHENDVLLVGDDPWEEFVNCVCSIKILSPLEVQQMILDVDFGLEVQQMSLDGDFGNSVLTHQSCSSSDNGDA